jgi:UDP-N-acetylglucosamine acyltransferase
MREHSFPARFREAGETACSGPPDVHPTAVVEPGCQLARGVRIGPYCMVSGEAVIGEGTVLANGVTILGRVRIGRRNSLHTGCVIGGEPQDISYRGTATEVVIGDANVIREGVTINRGSEKENGQTVLGSHNFLMAASHVAHDCQIGDHVTIANGTLLGGHVRVESHASLSGAVAVHHFVRIGSWAFVAGISRVLGMPARPRCANLVALRRGGFAASEIEAIVEAHRLLYRAKAGLAATREILEAHQQLLPQVQELLAFIATQQEGRHGRALERRMAA